MHLADLTRARTSSGSDNDVASLRPPVSSAIRIRRIESMVQYRACEALQARVWGAGDFVHVSALVLITAQNNGGIVLGAFDADERLAGFVCSYPGLTDAGVVKQCSQLLAVDPEYRGRGVGFRLKLAQREAALVQGLEWMTWTFDPLASVNAHFNMVKLGCTVGRYVVDCYGTPESGLNGGLSSDRLVAEWELRNPRVAAPISGSGEADEDGWINRVEDLPGSGLPVNREVRLDLGAPELLLEIPPDIGAIKRRDMALARAWRAEVRQVFLRYLDLGYRAEGFGRWVSAGRARSAYRLRLGRDG